MAYLDHRGRRARGAAVLIVALCLAGCGGGGISNPLPSISGRLPSWFGGSSAATAEASAPSTTSATPASGSRALEEDCPVADIRRGASTVQIAAKGVPAPTATDLRYQLTFVELARQCTLIGSTVRMRVGAQGRVIVGPMGAPSQVDVPLRYAVVREGIDPKTIVTKFKRLSVAVPPDAGSVLFTDIEEDLSFPMPKEAELLKYVVYVGFDEAGDRGAKPAAKKASRKR
jgi:hypothetical protein